MTPKELCLELINAQSEDEVTKIIEESVILNDEKNWVAYGKSENNVGTFLNQQSHPVAALTEKIINSIDAVLTAECKKQEIDPESAKAPRTMHQAVEKFFDIKDGDFSEIVEKRRREIAKNIMVIAEGDKKKPNIIVVDKGEGQNPKDFEDTFLSLHKKNKFNIPFVQGKFNMGSTGVIPFCGKKHYQLILSRKQPGFLNLSQRDFWGFTLIRYREPRGFEKSGIFEYCVDETGDILKFKGEPLIILPDNEILEFGSFVKMYEYKLEKPSSILLDLWRDLNRSLFNPAIPVLLYEARDYTGHSKDKILLGNKMRLRVGDKNFVEESLCIDAILGPFGMCRIEVVILDINAFKNFNRSKDEFSTQKDAIFFTINGQTHATLGRSFIKNKASLDYLADYMIVNIDLSKIPGDVRDHVFMGSRDRMRDDEIRKNVEEVLAEELRKHERLRELNQQKREQSIASNPKDEAFVKKLLEKLVKSNSTIAEILGVGSEITHSKPGGLIEIPKFEGKLFPTFLKIHKFNSVEKVLCKKVPINSYAILKLETDAENQYLNRDIDKGELILSVPEILQSSHLWNGIITLKIIPKKEWKIGEVYHIIAQLTRCYDEPLNVEVDIEIGPEVILEKKPSVPDKTPKGNSLRLPKPVLVFKNENTIENCKTWAEMDWDGSNIVEVKSSLINGDSQQKQYDIYINMDSDDLHLFLRRKKISSKQKELIERLYQSSILLYSLVLYNNLMKSNQEELLPTIMQGIAKVCLDLGYSKDLIKSIED